MKRFSFAAWIPALVLAALACGGCGPAGSGSGDAGPTTSSPDGDGPAPDAAGPAPDGAGPAPDAGGTVTFDPDPNPCGRTVDPPASGQVLNLISFGSVAMGSLRFQHRRVLAANPLTWALWDIDQRLQLASGMVAQRPDGSGFTIGFVNLAGALLVTEAEPYQLQLRDGSDARVLATIDISGAVQEGLAPDGSYVWAASATALTAWGPNGALLATQAGDYRNAVIAAVPGELHVANGPAGVDRLETLDVRTGEARLSPPLPGVTSVILWLDDGQRVYVTDGISQEWIFDAAGGAPLANGTSLFFDGGYGDYMWRLSGSTGQLEIFSISRGLVRVAAYPACEKPSIAHGRLIFALETAGFASCSDGPILALRLDLPDLAAPETTRVLVSLKLSSPRIAFSEDGAEYVWTVGNGAITTPDGKNMGCGYARAFAGANDGTLAVATDVGVVLVNVGANGDRVEGTFDVLADRLEISADGQTLAVGAGKGDGVAVGLLQTFSLASKARLHAWGKAPPVDDTDRDAVREFSLARTGNRLAMSFLSQGSDGLGATYEIRLSDAAGGGATDTVLPDAGRSVMLSPNGAYLLASPELFPSVLFQGATRLGTVGFATAWWDDGVYLTRRDDVLTADPLPVEAHDIAGNLVPGLAIAGTNVDGRGLSSIVYAGDLALPVLVPSAGGVTFSQPGHQILDRATGAVILDGGYGLRAVAGGLAIQWSVHALVATPYR